MATGDVGMTLRLGDVLVRQGVITADQRDAIVAEQAVSHRPFGWLAERMFGVSPLVVESAWAEQYRTLTRVIDPRKELIDPVAISRISRRQAWQFNVLPIRHDGDELMVATTQDNVGRALRFLNWSISDQCFIVLAGERELEEVMVDRYGDFTAVAEVMSRRAS